MDTDAYGSDTNTGSRADSFVTRETLERYMYATPPCVTLARSASLCTPHVLFHDMVSNPRCVLPYKNDATL